jgi:ribosomal protein S18 acetylase RimI-like enzyme
MVVASGEFPLRSAVLGDGPAVASVFTAARALMSYLPALHSAEEDIAFFSEQVLPSSIVTVAESSTGVVIGFSAVKDDWLDHLYVAPAHQRHGVGSSLLRAAMNDHPAGLSLWVFEENRGAQSLYSRVGFEVVERTDGSRNEERQPDVRMRWDG